MARKKKEPARLGTKKADRVVDEEPEISEPSPRNDEADYDDEDVVDTKEKDDEEGASPRRRFGKQVPERPRFPSFRRGCMFSLRNRPDTRLYAQSSSRQVAMTQMIAATTAEASGVAQSGRRGLGGGQTLLPPAAVVVRSERAKRAARSRMPMRRMRRRRRASGVAKESPGVLLAASLTTIWCDRVPLFLHPSLRTGAGPLPAECSSSLYRLLFFASTRAHTLSLAHPSAQNKIECLRCGKADDVDFLLCETCDAGAHASCLGLSGVPEDAWFCPKCAAKAPKATPPAPRNLKGPKATPKKKARMVAEAPWVGEDTTSALKRRRGESHSPREPGRTDTQSAEAGHSLHTHSIILPSACCCFECRRRRRRVGAAAAAAAERLNRMG